MKLIGRTDKYLGCISILLLTSLCFSLPAQAAGLFLALAPQTELQMPEDSQADLQALNDHALNSIVGKYAAPPSADRNDDVAVILWDELGRNGDQTRHSSAVGEGNLQNNFTVLNRTSAR